MFFRLSATMNTYYLPPPPNFSLKKKKICFERQVDVSAKMKKIRDVTVSCHSVRAYECCDFYTCISLNILFADKLKFDKPHLFNSPHKESKSIYLIICPKYMPK